MRQRPIRARVSPEEYRLLQRLRERRPAQNPPIRTFTLGERLADRFASVVGSWRFIVFQSIILAGWITINGIGAFQHWDPYPFILLNLMLSFQAAYAAPIIMMSQNRHAAIDRTEAKHDYEVNQKAELEIALVQDKLTLLLEADIVELRSLLVSQELHMRQLEALLKTHLQK